MIALTQRLSVALVLLAASVAAAEHRKPVERTTPDKEPTTDQEFVVRALACEVAEVKFAEQAFKQAKSEQVREFAKKVSEDHMRMRKALMDKAKEMKVAVVEGLERSHRERAQRLAKLEGAEFDREYLQGVIDSHEKGGRLCEKWAKGARDEGLREWSAQSATSAKGHLEQARKLAKAQK